MSIFYRRSSFFQYTRLCTKTALVSATAKEPFKFDEQEQIIVFSLQVSSAGMTISLLSVSLSFFLKVSLRTPRILYAI